MHLARPSSACLPVGGSPRSPSRVARPTFPAPRSLTRQTVTLASPHRAIMRELPQGVFRWPLHRRIEMAVTPRAPISPSDAPMRCLRRQMTTRSSSVSKTAQRECLQQPGASPPESASVRRPLPERRPHAAWLQRKRRQRAVASSSLCRALGSSRNRAAGRQPPAFADSIRWRGSDFLV